MPPTTRPEGRSTRPRRAAAGKCWCVTWFYTTPDGPAEWASKMDTLVNDGDVRYAVWQVEACPNTQRPHIQGYVALKKRKRLLPVKTMLGMSGSPSLRKAIGTAKQNRTYCTKDESRLDGPWERGVMPEVGKAAVLQNLWSLMTDGPTFDLYDAVEDSPSLLGHEKSVNFARNIILEKKGNIWRDLKVYVFMGPPGTGKTLLARQMAGGYDQMHKVVNSSSTLWFDGYTGQDSIVFDDVGEGWNVGYEFWCQLLDGHPVRLPIKGTTLPACYHNVYLTSNSPILSWFKGRTECEAILRRITHIYTFTRGGDYFAQDGTKLGNALDELAAETAGNTLASLARGQGGVPPPSASEHPAPVVPGAGSGGNINPRPGTILTRQASFVAPRRQQMALVRNNLRHTRVYAEPPTPRSMPTSGVHPLFVNDVETISDSDDEYEASIDLWGPEFEQEVLAMAEATQTTQPMD